MTLSNVDRLLAEEEIRDVLMRFCRGVDRIDLDLVRSCYHPDAWDDHGSFRGPVEGLLATMATELPKMLATQHVLGQSLIEVDAARAECETYTVAYHRIAGGDKRPESILSAGARYLDLFERRNGGPWLIASRTVVLEWTRFDEVASPAGP